MGELNHTEREHYSSSLLRGCAAILLGLTLVAAARSQESTVLSEPEVLSVLYYLDASTKLVPLESQLVHRKQKLRSMGFTGGELIYSLGGQKSPIRLKPADTSNFVVRLNSGLDPVETIQFYHVGVVDRSRVIPIDNFNALGRVTKVTLHSIDFNAAKYGASSFKLVPIHALAPGEYCFLVKSGIEWPREVLGFCFGVDGP